MAPSDTNQPDKTQPSEFPLGQPGSPKADIGQIDSTHSPAQPTPAQIDSRSDRPLKESAVALLLYPAPEGLEGEATAGQAMVLFTVRTDRVADHKGQICFPGGSKDATDFSLEETALRELAEELGVTRESVRVIGKLPNVFTVVTRYVISPYLLYSLAPLVFNPAEFEVAEVFAVPVRALLDESRHRVEIWDTHGVPREVHFFDFEGRNIWGATARMLDAFLERYSDEWWEAIKQGENRPLPEIDSGLTPV